MNPEVEELKRQLKLARDFIVWCGLNAENEDGVTIRDKAIECEFCMNHKEFDKAACAKEEAEGK